jgi:ATP-binding cassette subfamily B protein
MTTLISEFTLPKRRQTDRRGPVRWLISHAIHYWFLGLVMLAGAFGNAALASVVPIYIGQAVENVRQGLDPSFILQITLWIAGTQVFRGLLQFSRNFGAELIGQRIERDTRDELYVSLLGKSMTFHSLQPVGDTMARATNDVRELNFLFSPGLNLVIGSANFLIMPILLAPRYHPALVITPALFMVGYFLALWQHLHRLNPVTSNVRQAFGQMNTRLAESIDGIETVKGMAQETSEVARFVENARKFRDAFVHQGNVEARFLPLLLLALAEAGGLAHAMLLYRQGLLTVGDVVAYFGLIQLFGFPVWTSLWAYSQISSGIAAARRILEMMNREDNLDQNIRGFTGPMRGEVEFRNVTFAYNGGDPVLKNVSFSVKTGQTVAIVGQTGSGKTSLVKLINRTYDVTSGEVCVDGLNVRDWNLEALRRKISIIEQDIFLFSRSISENIAFGDQDAPHEKIEAAANAAQAYEFIKSFRDGFNTRIGERGVTLSGGQRQRLALARAFLTDPRILILDDSTSAIDSATEDKIQRAIYAAAQGRTTFIITHRLSQIRWADLILVLRAGELAAIGTHDELMRTSEEYRRIFTENSGKGDQQPRT